MKKFLIILTLTVVLVNFNLSAQDALKTYQNYDFVPGDKIIFEDDFSTGMDGEFPPMWKLVSGQGVVNIMDGTPVFVITEGSYAQMAPRVKTPSYLDSSFTIEADYYVQDEDPGMRIFFLYPEGEDMRAVNFDQFGNVNSEYFPAASELQGKNPEADKEKTGVWRHVALAYKKGQMKCYVDQYRVLVIPDCEFTPSSVLFGGGVPVRIKNVKIANGGGMNMIDQIYKDGKFITHGILFDSGKSTIKPSSMGVLNQITKVMKEHADLKFSIEGHTDSDGADKSNQTLSEQRAESVKNALVELGIDASRFQTKGWGESKPMSTNDSPEGKADNRRVEFIKI